MFTTGNLYTDQLVSGFEFAQLMCWALGRGAFTSLAAVGPENSTYVQIGGWTGEEPDKPSRAPYIASAKVTELFYGGSAEGLSLTPIPDFTEGFGWMGGARYDDHIVGVSKWAEEHDRLLALLVLYSLKWQVHLHHVGFRYPTEEEMQVASMRLGLEPIMKPAEDHARIYHPVETDRSPSGVYYHEVQFFPDGPYDYAVHWDLAAKDPEHLLNFVAKAYGRNPVLWEAGSNDPIGAVGIPDKKGSILCVMAREHWTRVEDW